MIAVLLGVSEEFEVNVEHVFLGPHFALSCRAGVLSGRRDGQWNFVFVEVVLVVASESEEQAHLTIGQCGDVFGQCVGMNEELQMAVASQVEHGILVDSTSIAGCQVAYGECHRLFVVLQHYGVSGVDDAADARWKDIVYRLFLVVFLKVHRTDLECSAGVRCFAGVEGLFVGAPFTADEVEGAEAQYCGIFEACEEHTHETDAREVGDVSLAAFVLVDGDAEEVPSAFVCLIVASLDTGNAAVDNEVLPDDHCFGCDADVILIVFLVFVERIVRIDVLGIGSALVGSRVVLRSVV